MMRPRRRAAEWAAARARSQALSSLQPASGQLSASSQPPWSGAADRPGQLPKGDEGACRRRREQPRRCRPQAAARRWRHSGGRPGSPASQRAAAASGASCPAAPSFSHITSSSSASTCQARAGAARRRGASWDLGGARGGLKAHPRRAVGRPYVHRQDQHSACLEVVKRLPLKCTVVRRYLHAQLGE